MQRLTLFAANTDTKNSMSDVRALILQYSFIQCILYKCTKTPEWLRQCWLTTGKQALIHWLQAFHSIKLFFRMPKC